MVAEEMLETKVRNESQALTVARVEWTFLQAVDRAGQVHSIKCEV